MEKLFYDLHIHSCLSPCGDEVMTPCNIANMALLKGLDVIALTDHNSCGNVRAVRSAARRAAQDFGGKELLVLSGFEIETAEEVHVLCLFALPEQAEAFENQLRPHFAEIPNRINIYGNQCLMNEMDEFLGEEERILAFAVDVSFQELYELTERWDGAFVPAHIDKPVYSILSNMGSLPPDLPIKTVEVSENGRQCGFLSRQAGMLSGYQVITSSDAHYLGDISEPAYYLEVEQRSETAVIRCLIYG